MRKHSGYKVKDWNTDVFRVSSKSSAASECALSVNGE
jgi:hypothetical protein